MSDARWGPWRRTAVVLAVATAVWWLTYQGLNRWFGPVSEDRVGHAARTLLTLVLGVGVVVAACRTLDRRRIVALGLTAPRDGLWGFVALGVAGWLVPVVVLLGASVLGGVIELSVPSWSTALVTTLGIFLAVLCFEAFPEELLFRGYVFTNLAERLPVWATVGSQAVLFLVWGVAIGAADTTYRMVVFFLFALGCGVLRATTGSVWTSIGFHLAFQAGEQTLTSTTAYQLEPASEFVWIALLGFFLFPLVLLVLAGVRSFSRPTSSSPTDRTGPD